VAKMNGIKFKWMMLFSYKHYRKWNKRSNKNWVMQILLTRQLPRKSVHIMWNKLQINSG